MKKALALISVVGTVLLAGTTQVYAADAAPSFAVVNVQQVFQQSPKIAELNKKLQSEFKGRQDKLIATQKTLQDEADKLKKEGPTMSQKDRDALQKKVNDDQADLTKDANTFQQDLNKEQSRIMKSVLAKLNEIIAGIAKKGKYGMVLDAQAVIYAADGADITKQVAKEFDEK